MPQGESTFNAGGGREAIYLRKVGSNTGPHVAGSKPRVDGSTDRSMNLERNLFRAGGGSNRILPIEVAEQFVEWVGATVLDHRVHLIEIRDIF